MTKVSYKVAGIKYTNYRQAKKESQLHKVPLITCYEPIPEVVHMTAKQKAERIK